MSKNGRKNIEQTVRNLIGETVANLGFELWDVEYYSESDEWYLEITIDRLDKSGGGTSINDCETVTRAVDPIIDAADPIENSYSLVVSSAGLNRELKNDFHINHYINKKVSVKLFSKFSKFSKNENISLLNAANKANKDGKSFTGVLKENAAGTMTFEVCKVPDKQKVKKNNIIDIENTEGIDNIITILKKDIAHIYAYDEIEF